MPAVLPCGQFRRCYPALEPVRWRSRQTRGTSLTMLFATWPCLYDLHRFRVALDCEMRTLIAGRIKDAR
jgi:hypothetical protein